MSIAEAKRKDTINEDEIEIRLKDITAFLKGSRVKVILGTIIGFVIGIIYSLSKPSLYTAKVTVMPEIQVKGAGGLGGLGSLAGLAGIDIGSMAGTSVDAIRPDIYPDILHSIPFGLQLLEKPVYSNLLSKETSLREFIEESNKSTLFSDLVSSKTDENLPPKLVYKDHNPPLQITKKQELLIRQIEESVGATYDKKTGIIMVSATFQDAYVAATVAQRSLEYLTDYITNYRTEKARNQVDFLSGQVKEARERYQASEYALSNYRDRNRNLYLNTAKIEEQRLQADFLLAQSVFNDLSKQFEQAKIKVAEEAPVFKVLEPAQIPLKKSAPKRSLIILGLTITGLFVGMFIHAIKQYTNYLKN